jgi:choline dehydrogenase
LKRGALSNCIWEVGGFVKSMPHLPHPDCQIGMGPFTLTANGVEAEPGLTMFGYVLRPESRGEISIVSQDPSKPPRIVANYLTAEMDRTHTAALYRYMRRICAQAHLKDYIESEIVPGPARVSDDDLVDAAFSMGTCAYHVSGTCRMGSDDAAVLDPQLRVRGVTGLRVADTSVTPTLISANTNGIAMVIGWRAAEIIKAG